MPGKIRDLILIFKIFVPFFTRQPEVLVFKAFAFVHLFSHTQQTPILWQSQQCASSNPRSLGATQTMQRRSLSHLATSTVRQADLFVLYCQDALEP